MTRRKFSREFKIEGVRLVTDREVAAAQAARDLDVAESVLRRWMRELRASPAVAFYRERADASRSGRDFGSEEGGRPAPGGA